MIGEFGESCSESGVIGVMVDCNITEVENAERKKYSTLAVGLGVGLERRAVVMRAWSKISQVGRSSGQGYVGCTRSTDSLIGSDQREMDVAKSGQRAQKSHL